MAISAALFCSPVFGQDRITLPNDGSQDAIHAVIDRPARPNGWCVVLFGGGLTHDADWTLPGAVDNNGESLQLTIDARPTRDGRAIAAALCDAGFTVARFGIERGAADPLQAFESTLDFSRIAWAELLKYLDAAPARTIAVGHSLGATRAILATDGEAGGYVLLAGAYLSPTATGPRALAHRALESWGGEPIGELAFRVRSEARGDWSAFSAVDADANGSLSGWELAAHERVLSGVEPERDEFRPGMKWASEVLIESGRPALSIWGGLDDTSVHGPLLSALAKRRGHERVECVYEPDLGHNLSTEQDGLVGPIEERVVAGIVAFAMQVSRSDRDD